MSIYLAIYAIQIIFLCPMKAVGRMVLEGERSVATSHPSFTPVRAGWSIVCESVRMYVQDYERASPHGEC